MLCQLLSTYFAMYLVYELIILPRKVIKSDTLTAELNEPKLCVVLHQTGSWPFGDTECVEIGLWTAG
jgi:hypothetical protein